MNVPSTTIVLLGLLAGCNNGPDDSPDTVRASAESTASGDGGSTDVTAFGDGAPSVTGDAHARDPVITMDNHVELLGNVFGIFSGDVYLDDLLTAPDHSNPAYAGKPDIDQEGSLVSPPVDIVCSNGGAASFVPESDGLFFDSTASWNFAFDNCQDGDRLLDGDLQREIFESISLESSGFTSESQTQLKRFAGSLERTRIGRFAFLHTEAVSFSLAGPMDALSISEATTRLDTDSNFGRMSGSFTVVAGWTDGQPIDVEVTEEFLQDEDPGLDGRGMKFDIGQIELLAGPDNRLVLSAGTGDLDTVEITVTADGTSETFATSWDPWVERFFFDSESGY